MHCGGKEGVLTRDWEAKLKVRIESLERLLAEERQKVSTAEKKLLLAGIDTISPSVSDDVKLRMREKELLQEELLKNQRHLHIATDQIQGLKERLQILEEEYQRLKEDYAKLYDEIDKPAEDKNDHRSSDSDRTPESLADEHPFLAKKISVVEAPHFRELKHKNAQTEPVPNGVDLSSMEAELACYKAKAKELEYQVEEINDIWRSKSNTSDKEKDELEKQLKDQLREMNALEQTVQNLKRELKAKDKLLAESQEALKEKENALARSSANSRDLDGEAKKRDQDNQTLITQISQRDSSIRDLNERIRIRDERLEEKDGIICKLNDDVEDQRQQTRAMNDKVQDVFAQLNEKDVMISVLRGQIIPSSPVRAEGNQTGLTFCQTDAEKETCRLREAVRQQQVELEKGESHRKKLEAMLEESKKATEDAAFLWEGERGEMQKEANILQEKVRMYEAYNSMCRDETIECLKEETQNYFREKEALQCQLSTLKLKFDTTQRQHKEYMAKLQGELSDKLKELKAEVDNNAHLNSEMERLTRQAELAYRLQQEERLLRAEHQAMKVRYETRIDKMNKEANKMLLTMTKLQKERDLDREIITKMQENLNAVKDQYTEQLLKSEEDRVMLERHVKEIEQSRKFVEQLQKTMRELREKCQDQERLRSELINKFSTDRTAWEIDRANLNSTINELKEQISSSSVQHDVRSKDIQVNMGIAWDKERREQKRLLQEAHTLALDLQEQLKARDEAFAHERKELLHQLEMERQTRTRDQRDSEKRAIVLESSDRKLTALQSQMKEVERRAQRELDAFRVEKVELLKQLAECKHAQSRDYRKLEEVMAGLSRLKELGTLLRNETPGTPQSDQERKFEQSILPYVKEAVCQISDAAEELSKYANNPSDGTAAQFLSETSAVKSEMTQHHESHDGDVIIATDVTSSRATTTSRIEEHMAPVSRRVSTQQFRDSTGQRDTERIVLERTSVTEDTPIVISTNTEFTNDPKMGQTRSPGAPETSKGDSSTSTIQKFSSSSTAQPAQSGPPSEAQPPCPVVLRSFDPSSPRRYDRPPSYTSGTRSANTSRATTPDLSEVGLRSAEMTLTRRMGFPDPPPSFVIPHHRSLQPGAQQEMFQKALQAALAKSNQPDKRTKRPAALMKSRSIDGSSVLKERYINSQGSRPPSLSASTTPTHPVTSAEITASFANQISTSPTAQNVTSTISLYADKFSPRTARRKFFEEPNLFKTPSYPQSYQSLPTRGGGAKSVDSGHATYHYRQTSLPDPEEVRREAEEEHDLVTSRVEALPHLTSSTSWDEKMQHNVPGSGQTQLQAKQEEQQLTTSDTMSSTSAQAANTKPTSAKDKRKFFKKASSLDAAVGSSIAKAGVSAITPGAPTGFTPSDIFAAVKGKLKSQFRKKSSDGKGSKGQEVRSPSPPLFIQTEVPDTAASHFGARGSVELPVPVPRVEIGQSESRDQEEVDQVAAELPSERSRSFSRRSDLHQQQMTQDQWRSKSVDRAGLTPSVTQIHGDVIRPVQGVWKFNETAV